MGGAVSSQTRRFKNWSANVRETRRQRRLILQHYKTLIQVLCLEELKEKVPDEALPTSEDFGNQVKSIHANNEDVTDLDHSGLEQEENELEEKTTDGDEFLDLSGENFESGRDTAPPMSETRPSSVTGRGRQRFSEFAGRSIERLVGSFSSSRGGKKMKPVDVFSLPPESKKNNGPLWLQKALDAHDLVTYLESQIEDFLNEHEEELHGQRTVVGGGLECPPKLITPGTILRGTIHIPGSEMRTAYELFIVRANTNELGDRYYVARHIKGSNRDKQAVILRFDEDDAEQTEIAYGDLETTCHGFITQASVRGRMVENKAGKWQAHMTKRTHKRLKDGDVDELEDGEEGFFKDRTQQHSFHLTRADESSVEELVELYEKVLLAKAGRAMAFAYWSIISSNSKVVDEAFPGRQIDWGEIMEDTIWLVEEVNANMRRQAELLHSLDFISVVERKNKLGQLEKKGISRAQAHSSWDAATVFMNSIKDRRPSGSGFARKYSDIYNQAEESLERQTKSYERLDAAIRTAETRVCQSDIQKWSQPKEEWKRISQEVNCSICLDLLQERRLVLPCTHTFHVHCAERWFHTSSFCPVCRQEYGKSDN